MHFNESTSYYIGIKATLQVKCVGIGPHVIVIMFRNDCDGDCYHDYQCP